jgi:virulence-associated protein VapD
MCHKKVNKLLYSSNAKKELSFYLNQKKSLLKVKPVKNGIEHLSHGRRKPVKSISEKQKLEKTYENIKKSIEDYKQNRNKSLVYLKNKNQIFNNSQIKLEKKLSKLYYKSVNEIRLKGYEKALNKCLNLSINNKNFTMPKIELNANDVYSRLYNNYILNCRKRKRKNSKKKTNYNHNDNDDNSTNNYNNYNYNEHNQSENLINYHQFLKNDTKKKL